MKFVQNQLQLMKEELLHKKMELDEKIQRRNKDIEEARKCVLDKKRFDDIFRLVDSCYHKQLLELELKEQLTVARALQEQRQYVELIQGLSENCTANELGDSALDSWYKEMKDHVQKRIPGSCSDDEPFFNIKLSSSDEAVNGCSTKTLSFATRRKGHCLSVTIFFKSACYKVSSDIQLEGLEIKCQEFLQNGLSANKFVEVVVWPLMENQLCL